MAIAKDKLEKWQALNDQRLRLQRESKTVGEAIGLLEEEFEKELTDSGKPSITRNGFVLAWEVSKKKVNVEWKKEFLRECGVEKATKLQEASKDEETKKFTILPPATPAA